MFAEGKIHGLRIEPIKRHRDQRGWLAELFRLDELDQTIFPQMAYVSTTHPGIVRGPHEHVHQTDFFVFMGPGTFLFACWDNRKTSPTYQTRETRVVGAENPSLAVVPPGIVHTYANIGAIDGMVFNCPNQLFAGRHRKEAVDEIRHESDPNSPFVRDFSGLSENRRRTA